MYAEGTSRLVSGFINKNVATILIGWRIIPIFIFYRNFKLNFLISH